LFPREIEPREIETGFSDLNSYRKSGQRASPGRIITLDSAKFCLWEAKHELGS